MTFIERGSGHPLVLIPGIQGRWEWMRPAVDALARHFRVITFSLAGERSSGCRLDPTEGFDGHVRQIDEILGLAGVDTATVCGVSYGGLVAVRYAAVRPARVDRLILVSTPPPSWRPDDRVRRYEQAPNASVVAFVAGAPGRLWREITAALPARRDRWRAAAGYLFAIVATPASPRRMAMRVKFVGGHDFVADSARVVAKTLVIAGEPHLDRVVPVEGTREYLKAIPGAIGRTFASTGHIGLVTRPVRFAEMIREFAG